MNDGPPRCQIVELRKIFIRCTKLEAHVNIDGPS
jgi:hypothetical protein